MQPRSTITLQTHSDLLRPSQVSSWGRGRSGLTCQVGGFPARVTESGTSRSLWSITLRRFPTSILSPKGTSKRLITSPDTVNSYLTERPERIILAAWVVAIVLIVPTGAGMGLSVAFQLVAIIAVGICIGIPMSLRQLRRNETALSLQEGRSPRPMSELLFSTTKSKPSSPTQTPSKARPSNDEGKKRSNLFAYFGVALVFAIMGSFAIVAAFHHHDAAAWTELVLACVICVPAVTVIAVSSVSSTDA